MSLAPYADPGEYFQEINKIVYSNAYKRLAHKSQIIIKPKRDHFRSRLTHTEEVHQIALSLGKKLELNLDLITAMAKAHDLGHTPFGHAGERAIQLILERELLTRFKMKYPKSEKEKENFRREIFHHSLNSARMLIKERDFEGIPTVIIEGVLTHSWSPWKQKSNLSIPRTYEAQVVAIADQLASINHDTEDIIEGAPYTEYSKERFVNELIDGFKKRYPKDFNKLRNEIHSLIVDKSFERGYGRQKRVEVFVNEIVENTKKMFIKNNITKKEQAENFPISLSEEWSHFLDYYETFVRDLVQEKISWFIARDNMAGALISTVFNHFWPRARSSVTITQMTLPMFEKEELAKTPYTEKTKYIEHFADFFNEHYFEEKHNKDFYKEYLEEAKQKGISVWDINIRNSFKDKITTYEEKLLTRLVAVIDFIAGLTDRYCLEMFNEVYKEFVIT